MALYIPAGRRRRRVIITGAVALVVGLLLGWGLGRVTAPKAEDQAAAAKQAAARVTGQLESQTIHYGQAQRGEIDKAGYLVSLDDALTRADRDLTTAFESAPWIDQATRDALHAQIATLRTRATSGVPPDEYEQATTDAVRAINAAFGTTR